MHDQVGTQQQWLLQARCREGVVHATEDGSRTGQCRDGRNIDDMQQRIGRRLDPDQAGLRSQCGLDIARIAHVDKGKNRDRQYAGRTWSKSRRVPP
jgi:hypothetical protein